MKKSLLTLFTMTLLTGQVANGQSCTDVCPAVGLSSSFEWIQGVSIGPLTNISGNNNGYADFGDSFSANFNAGTTISYTVAAGYGDGPFSESWKAWMDFNQDGDFDDPGEEIFTNFGQFQVSGSFFIPSTALNGSTKLRIAMGFGSFPTVCENVGEGEIEDYCVNIVGGVSPSCDSSEPVTGLIAASTADFFVLLWDPVPNSVGCRVSGGQNGNFNITRNVIGSEPSSLSFATSALAPGDYNWKVVCGCSLTPPFDLTPDSEVGFFEVPAPSASDLLSGGAGFFSEISLSPNPTWGNLNLAVTAVSNASEQIIVTDLLGRTVIQENVNVMEGRNNITMDVNSLSRGTYILILRDGNNGMTSARFIKK